MHGSGAEISREIFWNILGDGFPTGQIVLYMLAAIAILLFFRGLSKSGFFIRLKIAANATGTDVNRLDKPWSRFWYMFVDIFVHRKILREPYQGIFHFSILWGFIVLFIATSVMSTL